MPLEGPEVFRELEAALARSRGALDETRAEADRLGAEMRDLMARRGEALLKLARHYLPEVSRAAIESTFEGIRADLLAILAGREASRDELRAQLDRANEEAARRDAEVDAVTAKLNGKVALREQLEAQVAETLKGNADFQGRSKLALRAEEDLHRDERRVEEMARESAEKLPAYDHSRLFRYLHDRGYGTSDYRPSEWARSLDRRVADLIDYPLAKQGYEFLKKAHELVAAEVSRRRDQFSELMGQVEAIEKAEADRAGLTAVLDEGGALGAERDRLVRGVERLRNDARGVQQRLSELDEDRDEFHRRAIERFRSFLGEAKLALLRERARQTPEPADDEIVDDLSRLDDQIRGIEPALAGLSASREAADRVRAGLERVLRRYRQANYDSERSTFEGLDLRGGLGRLEGGEIDAEALWRSIEKAQKFRPSWVGEAASGGIEFAASPAGRVILGAIVDIAGAAMREAAYRGVQRRSDAPFPDIPTFPPPGGGGSRPPSRPSSDSEGGFTTGEGF